MKIDRIVVNTLAFQYLLEEKGHLQHELFPRLKELDIHNVEVRREYIRDYHEYKKIMQTAHEYGLAVFYSVPDSLFSGGSLKRDLVHQYIEEAKAMKAKMVKFTRGEFNGWSEDDINSFMEITREFKGVITVENDQTQASGKMEALLTFLRECEIKEIPIYATFDVGNGHWVGETPSRTAPVISSFTRFVHLKDVNVLNGKPSATYLGEGFVPWRKILTNFEEDIYAAIEYPCGKKPFERLKEECSKLVKA